MNEQIDNENGRKDLLQNILSVVQASSEITELLRNGQMYMAQQLCKCVLDDGNIAGDADDYHNLSIVFFRNKDYKTAYDVVSYGLKKYPCDLDLLADSICYGLNITVDCDEFYERISSISVFKWGWRAYYFSSLYLRQKIENSTDEHEQESLFEEVLKVVRNYRIFFPADDSAYTQEIRIRTLRKAYCLSREDKEGADNEEKTIDGIYADIMNNKALYETDAIVKCVDYLLEKGAYQQLLDFCKKYQAVTSLNSQNSKLIMYVKALAEDSLLHEMPPSSISSDLVSNVYYDYYSAIQLKLEDSQLANIFARCITLSRLSGEAIPDRLLSILSDHEKEL